MLPVHPFSGMMILAACLPHQAISVDLLSLGELQTPLWHMKSGSLLCSAHWVCFLMPAGKMTTQ